MQYLGSKDAKVSGAGIIVRTGWKWKAPEAVQQAKARLKQKALIRTVAQGKAGVRSSTPNCCITPIEKDRSRLVQERASRVVAMKKGA